MSKDKSSSRSAAEWVKRHPAPRNTPVDDARAPWRAVLVVDDVAAFAATYLEPFCSAYQARGAGRFPVQWGPTRQEWVCWLVDEFNAHHAREGSHMEAEPDTGSA